MGLDISIKQLVGCKMASTRTKIGKILFTVLVSLLLIGIVSSKFPELLSLTDNTANDFAVLKANIVVLRILPAAGGPFRIADIDSSHPGSTLHSSALITFEKAAPHSSELFILYSVLRT
jgi:hypothetical protein